MDQFSPKYPPQFLVANYVDVIADAREAYFLESLAQDFSFFICMSMFVSGEAFSALPTEARKGIVKKWENNIKQRNEKTLNQMLVFAEQFPLGLDVEDYNENFLMGLAKFKEVFLTPLLKEMSDD